MQKYQFIMQKVISTNSRGMQFMYPWEPKYVLTFDNNYIHFETMHGSSQMWKWYLNWVWKIYVIVGSWKLIKCKYKYIKHLSKMPIWKDCTCLKLCMKIALKALVKIVFDRFKKVKTVLADLYNYVLWVNNSQDTKNNENHAFTMKLSMNFEFILIYE